MNPRSTDCEANALTTTPSRRFEYTVFEIKSFNISKKRSSCRIVHVQLITNNLIKESSFIIFFIHAAEPADCQRYILKIHVKSTRRYSIFSRFCEMIYEKDIPFGLSAHIRSKSIFRTS